MQTMTDPAPLAPVSARERIEALDVVRGFALLGILLMNIEAFAGPMMEALSGVNPRFSGADRWADAAVYVLVQGKFFTLFSLLFGMGFAIMLQRAEAAGRSGARLYARRLLALLGIGLAHALLVWSGDILLTYALLGFVLLAGFRRTPVSRLPKWTVVLYLLPLLLTWLWALGVEAAKFDPQAAAAMQRDMAGQAREFEALAQAQREAYGAGGYLDAVAQRAQDTALMLGFLAFGGPIVLAMFVLGSWFVRSGVMADPGAHLPLLRRLRNAGFALGLPLMLWSVWRMPTMDLARMDFGIALAQSAALVANLLLCLAYFASLVLALQSPAWRVRLAWLAPAGRMALSNYLLQSVVCTLVFYGYGLGLFERLPRLWQVPFALALFGAQVLLSRWWLSRYRFGPAEWLWRWLTYGRRPPMRAAPGAAFALQAD